MPSIVVVHTGVINAMVLTTGLIIYVVVIHGGTMLHGVIIALVVTTGLIINVVVILGIIVVIGGNHGR
jgi:hypothetical protein